MNEGLYAALRTGVETGAIPVPIGGESLNDYRFRVAHAGALIGIQWLTDEVALAALEDDQHQDATSQGWRPGDSTVTPLVPLPPDPPVQKEAAGV